MDVLFVYVIFGIVLSIIDYSVFGAELNAGILSNLYFLGMFIPGLAALVRRMHDTGNSGHQIWWFLTIIGAFWVFYLSVKRGDIGQNNYDVGGLGT